MKTPPEPIDLVYCWCDMADPVFAAKMNALRRKLGMPVSDDGGANGKCRYRSNDELKYSLRSAEINAPWINRVFLVVDDDISLPSWLDAGCPKLTVTRLGEIMPREILPTFNSRSIEFHLPYVKGLSERFLYANDDMLFAAPADPGFFYAKDGYPKFRYLKSRVDLSVPNAKDAYIQGIANSQRFVRDNVGVKGDFRKSIGRLPHHNIDAYLKSDTLEFADRFSAELEKVVRHPFRDASQFQRDAWAAYAMAVGHGHFRAAQRPWWETMFGAPHRDSWYCSLGKKNAAKNLKRIRPKLFCVNDNPSADDSDRENGKTFLESLFPSKSSFEKENS